MSNQPYKSLTSFVTTRKLGPVMVVGTLIAALVGLITFPLPSIVLDMLVALNLLSGILLLLAVLYMRSLTELSTFAVLLLVTTIFRLATSVSTTRSILSGDDPGAVIRTFGEFVVGGSVAVGLVVFLIIAIVQFIVVTKGAERTAEVAARFTLDATPGRQLAIEADVRSEAITQEQGNALRKELRSENQIIASLDGAMKFVKGDSIASLIIVFVNLVGGLAVGVVVMGMPLSDAGKHFSILTIGDGLVAQVPSVLSAIAAGVFVSRAGNESRENVLSTAMREICTHRTPLAVGACLLFFGGLIPGMPHVIFWSMSCIMVASLIIGNIRSSRTAETAIEPNGSAAMLAIGKHTDPYLCHVRQQLLDRLNGGDFNGILTSSIKAHVTILGIGLPLVLFHVKEDAPADSIVLVFEGIKELCIPVTNNTPLEDIAKQIVSSLVKRFIYNFGSLDVAYYIEQNQEQYPYLKSLSQWCPSGLLERVFQQMLFDGMSIAHPRPIIMSLEQAVKQGLTEFEDAYPKVRLALIERIIDVASMPDGRIILYCFPDRIQELAASASESASDVESVWQKQQAFDKLILELKNNVDIIPQNSYLVRDETRFAISEACFKCGKRLRIISETEKRLIDPDRLTQIEWK